MSDSYAIDLARRAAESPDEEAWMDAFLTGLAEGLSDEEAWEFADEYAAQPTEDGDE